MLHVLKKMSERLINTEKNEKRPEKYEKYVEQRLAVREEIIKQETKDKKKRKNEYNSTENKKKKVIQSKRQEIDVR